MPRELGSAASPEILELSMADPPNPSRSTRRRAGGGSLRLSPGWLVYLVPGQNSAQLFFARRPYW